LLSLAGLEGTTNKSFALKMNPETLDPEASLSCQASIRYLYDILQSRMYTRRQML